MELLIGIAVGAAIGIGIMAYAEARVRDACQAQKSRMQKLLEENNDLQNQLRQKFVQEAYAAGLEEGRKNPYEDAERFARNFAGKRIKYALNVNENQ